MTQSFLTGKKSGHISSFETEDFVQLSEVPEAQTFANSYEISWTYGQPSWTSVDKLKNLGRSS